MSLKKTRRSCRMQVRRYMLTLIQSLTSPLLSLMFLILGSGLFNTFVSIRLELVGCSPETIGIVVASSYLGILAGSLKISAWISRFGHTRSFIHFASMITLIVLAHAIWLDPWVWAILRFLGGIFLAGIFIVIESWLLLLSPHFLRGKILSVYLAVLYGSLSFGQFFLNLA